MRGFTYLSLLATASVVAARSAQHVGKTLPEIQPRIFPRSNYGSEEHIYPQMNKRQVSVNASSN